MRTVVFLFLAFLHSFVSVRAESIFDLAVTDIDGKAGSLAPYRGRVLLIVNVASECGYTSQYQGLQELHEKYQAKGLTVIGVPCNQFGEQEPGSNADIKKFCSTQFKVTFPLLAKTEVNGAGRHPLYTALAGKGSPVAGNLRWNFEKFLVGRDGKVLQRFGAGVEPDAEELTKAIEAALAAAPKP